MALTNSEMGDVWLEEGHISSLAIPFNSYPSFAIPVVESQLGSNTTYVQKTDDNNRVSAFEPFSGSVATLALSKSLKVNLGSAEILGMVDPEGRPHAGTRKELAHIASNWLRDVTSPMTRMSFARLCDNNHMELEAARLVFGDIRNQFVSRSSAVSCFISSTMGSDLSDAISSDPRLAQTYRKDDVTVIVRGDQIIIEIKAGIEANARTDWGAKLSKMIKLLAAVTSFNVVIRDQEHLEASRRDTIPESDVARLVPIVEESVRRATRQEERLAIILRAMIDNPASGRMVALRHHDRGRFVNAIIPLVLRVTDASSESHAVENALSTVIVQFIRQAYPLQRARLVRDLLVHLGDLSVMGNVLRNFILTSRSRDILDLESEMLRSGSNMVRR